YPNRAIGTSARLDLKGPKGLPIIGNLVLTAQNAERFNDHLSELSRKYGETCTYTLPGMRIVVISTPKQVEHVLKDNFQNYLKGPHSKRVIRELFGDGIFNVDGESWKFQRKLLIPVFQGKNFREIICHGFEEHTKIVLAILSKAAETGETIDLQSLFLRFTFDVFTKICFNKNFNILTNPENVATFVIAFDHFQSVIMKRAFNPLWPILEMFSETGRNNRKYRKILDDFACSMIRERLQEPLKMESPTDILQLFMDAKNANEESLNDKELRDMILNVMAAGRDTSAIAMSWMMYRIMTNPSVEKNLLKEFDSRVTPENPISDYDNISKFAYAQATLNETLRLHPSLPINAKITVKDDILPGGIPVNAGDMVFWAPYSMGRDEHIWGKDANEFKPERFLKSGEFIRPSSFKHAVFNAGPRICPGQEFATIEVIILITTMLKNYSFELLTNEKKITYSKSIFLPMKHPLMVKVTKREVSVS
ncbi:568_t:CDS:2, partial [Ambispora gerdemannii]